MRRLLYESRYFWGPLLVVLAIALGLLLVTGGLSDATSTGYTAF